MSDSNDRLNEILIEQIEKFDGATDKAVDFVVEQTPELIQQLLMWHGVKSGVFFVIDILLIVCIYTGLKRARKWQAEETYADAFDIVILHSVFAFAGILMFIAACNSIDWLQILVAPKLYLLEYAAGLVR